MAAAVGLAAAACVAASCGEAVPLDPRKEKNNKSLIQICVFFFYLVGWLLLIKSSSFRNGKVLG